MNILGIVASQSSKIKSTVTGGTLTSDSTYFYRSFTGNGTLSIADADLLCDFLVIGGGGGGGSTVGGGGVAESVS